MKFKIIVGKVRYVFNLEDTIDFIRDYLKDENIDNKDIDITLGLINNCAPYDKMLGFDDGGYCACRRDCIFEDYYEKLKDNNNILFSVEKIK